MNMRALLAAMAFAAMASTPDPAVYRDPAGRFTFSYPELFGTPSTGTDDGFQDRVAAVRFEAFPALLGREAVLTRGFPLIDLQAAGGLYDEITLQILPAPLRQQVVARLPRLTALNLCSALAASEHVDSNLPAFAGLTAQQRAGIAATDRMNNQNVRLVRCQTADDIVVFDKERSAAPDAPRQHVFGAVRFLSGRYSTFQFIAGGAAPDETLLSAITDVVRSFAPGDLPAAR